MNCLRKYMFWLKNYYPTVSQRRIPEFWKYWQMKIGLKAAVAYFENICHMKEEKQHEIGIHIQAQSRCFKHMILFTARRQGLPA